MLQHYENVAWHVNARHDCGYSLLGRDAEHRNESSDSKQIWEFFYQLTNCLPIQIAARSKTCFRGRSLARFVGSNPAGGMDICLLWLLYIVR
jgi:hypothetical protein